MECTNNFDDKIADRAFSRYAVPIMMGIMAASTLATIAAFGEEAWRIISVARSTSCESPREQFIRPKGLLPPSGYYNIDPF